jgi:hypothetical protein
LDAKEDLTRICGSTVRRAIIGFVNDVLLVTLKLSYVISAVVPSGGVVNLIVIDGFDQQSKVD